MKSVSVAILVSAAAVVVADYPVYPVLSSTSTTITAAPSTTGYPVWSTSTSESECSEETTSSAQVTTAAPPPVYSTMTYPIHNTTSTTTTEDDCTEEYPTGSQTYPVYTPSTVHETTTYQPTTHAPPPAGTGSYPPIGHPNTTVTTGATQYPGTTLSTSHPTTHVPVPPTSVHVPSGTASSPPSSIPTAGAAANSVGMLAILGAAAVYFL